MAEVTVVFADLTGSTGVFESLGNAKATQAITRLTQWIGKVSQAYRGHVVKYLGDGVLVVFPDNADAIDAVTELQRVHSGRSLTCSETSGDRLILEMTEAAAVGGTTCPPVAAAICSRSARLHRVFLISASLGGSTITTVSTGSVRFSDLSSVSISGPCTRMRTEPTGSRRSTPL